MKTSKMGEDEALCRKALNRFATWLARLTPEQRREAVAKMLPASTPAALGCLAKVLIRKLESKDRRVSDGASDTLSTLGSHVLSTLQLALIAKPTERRLLHLAPVAAAAGRGLSAAERTNLQMTLFIAAQRARTPGSRTALWAAVGTLRDQECAASEAENEDEQKRQAEREAEMLASYSRGRFPKRRRSNPCRQSNTTATDTRRMD